MELFNFEIENNFETRVTEESIGIGLKNLKQRLKLLYPNKHKLHIEVKDDTYKLSLKIDTK